MREFELIRQVFSPVAQAFRHPDVILGPGDDCAIQSVPAGHQLVFSVDTLVEGVHFPPHYAPDLLAYRALAVAVSDLAAMGASPVCFTLAISLPSANSDWLLSFGRGLGDAASTLGIALAGGDTTRGPLSLTVQVHGIVPEGEAVRRNGAAPGQLIGVSGSLGEARAALDWLDTAEPSKDVQSVLQCYHRPAPRIALGQVLRPHVSAMIDVSDGLLADLGHVLALSGCGARLDVARLPLSEHLKRAVGDKAVGYALTGGDDYELCFTIEPQAWVAIQADLPGAVTIIGETRVGEGVEFQNGSFSAATEGAGYDHFGDDVSG
ncbi:thiamine-phosphate kinase [Marinobacter sp. 1Y8]